MRLNIFNSLFGLCVATAAVSCSNDQVIDDLRPAGGNDSDMISFIVADNNTRGGSFGNRPGSSTRATVTMTNNINTQGNTFAVYGEMTGLESSSDPIVIFNGDEVIYNGSEWKYSNLRYWFTDREYSFVALYPHTFSGLSDLKYENNRLAFTYTLPSDYSTATDILIAGHRRKCESSSSNTQVELYFGHILSRINFVATVDPGIEIKKITIKDLVSDASYSVQPATIRTGTETSDLTLNDPVWSLTSTKISVTKQPTSSTVKVDNATNTIELFPPLIDPLFVIPQGTNNIKVEVVYSKNNGAEKTIEGSLSSTSIGAWISGKSYTYSFTINDSDYIVFDNAELTDWGEDLNGSSYIIID